MYEVVGGAQVADLQRTLSQSGPDIEGHAYGHRGNIIRNWQMNSDGGGGRGCGMGEFEGVNTLCRLALVRHVKGTKTGVGVE